MRKQISDLKLVNESWIKTDSLRKLEVMKYQGIIIEKNEALEDLQKNLKRKRKVIAGTTASSCLLLVICLLLK